MPRRIPKWASRVGGGSGEGGGADAMRENNIYLREIREIAIPLYSIQPTRHDHPDQPRPSDRMTDLPRTEWPLRLTGVREEVPVTGIQLSMGKDAIGLPLSAGNIVTRSYQLHRRKAPSDSKKSQPHPTKEKAPVTDGSRSRTGSSYKV
ncbi:hypothetical protein HYFRA_00010655 [Hymenoscyphus fraxineus]|uniref:Uncharacterized protein n=1 Tax=Hymenoscyphus fraxineus TaxID=746836 RepID=A0A9N9L4Z2_9HELO|nr:hypothetical protein HYFRA_00010655 [Hymenoscyphus fraxineus]